MLLVAWTIDQHIPASRFWNVQCSELLPCICCFIGNAHTQMDAADLHGHGSNCFTRPTPWSCIFRIFCFGFVAPTIFSHITCNSKGTSTLLIRISVGRTKWKVVRYSWINSTFWTLDISGSLVFRHCLDMIRSGEALLPGWTSKGLHVCWVCWNSTCVLLQSRFGSLFHGLAMPPIPSHPSQALRPEARGCGRFPSILFRSHLGCLWRLARKVQNWYELVHQKVHVSTCKALALKCHFEWNPSSALHHQCSTLCAGWIWILHIWRWAVSVLGDC